MSKKALWGESDLSNCKLNKNKNIKPNFLLKILFINRSGKIPSAYGVEWMVDGIFPVNLPMLVPSLPPL